MRPILAEPTAFDQCITGSPFGAWETPVNAFPSEEVPVLRELRALQARIGPRTVGTTLVGCGVIGQATAAALSGSMLPCESSLNAGLMLIGLQSPQKNLFGRGFPRCSEPPSIVSTGTVIFSHYVDGRTGLIDVPSRGISGYRSLLDGLTMQKDADIDGVASRKINSNAYSAFKELGKWLLLGDDELAKVVGVRRTTPYSWERDGREPRPETARRLFQLHATVATLVDRLGEAATQRWIAAGNPSPVSLLRRHDQSAVDKLVHEMLFRPSRRRAAPGGFIPDDEPDLPPSALASQYRAEAPQRSK